MERLESQQPLVESAQELAAKSEQERREAERVANRYGLELVDMSRFRIDNDLFRSVPLELMLRYEFVPEHQLPDRLSIVMADPQDVRRLDDLELLLGQPVEVKVGVRSTIEEIFGTGSVEYLF